MTGDPAVLTGAHHSKFPIIPIEIIRFTEYHSHSTLAANWYVNAMTFVRISPVWGPG
jgi:hypothetical protein